MIKKVDYSYSEIRGSRINYYIDQKENLNNKNIESYNDYITDEVIGKYGFLNEIEEFFNILAICVGMAKINCYDEYIFNEIKIMIEKYKNKQYDKYLYDLNDKETINSDINTIEIYLKRR